MQGIFEAGQSYVALSRVRSLSGLYLKNYRSSLIYCRPEIEKHLATMNKLTATARCETLPKCTLSIAYQNVQGLNSKLPDIKMNKDMNDKDVIMVTETWLSNRVTDETVTLDGYNICRNDRKNNDGRGGVAIYVANHIKYEQLPIQAETIEHTSVLVQVNADKILLLTIYKPPSQKKQDFLKALYDLMQQINLTSYDTIIAGDFNENLLTDTAKPIKELFEEYEYTQLVNAVTTRYGTLLDAVYVRSKREVSTRVLPAYYSDHEAINVNVLN